MTCALGRRVVRLCSVVAALAVVTAFVGVTGLVVGTSSPVAGATSGRCPLAGDCTLKAGDGLHLSWDPSRPPPSPVRLTRGVQLPGSTWELGYAGFEIKVGTPGLQLCLAVRTGRAVDHRYAVELARCHGGRRQEWTVGGTFTFGKDIRIESLAHHGTCLTARGRGRRPAKGVAVVQRCVASGSAPAQTWST